MAVVPNSGLAIAARPRHFGSAKSRIDVGRFCFLTSLVFTIKTLARAAKPCQ